MGKRRRWPVVAHVAHMVHWLDVDLSTRATAAAVRTTGRHSLGTRTRTKEQNRATKRIRRNKIEQDVQVRYDVIYRYRPPRPGNIVQLQLQ
jgi:hypothetical protein